MKQIKRNQKVSVETVDRLKRKFKKEFLLLQKETLALTNEQACRITEQSEHISYLQKELAHIKSKWWYKLFSK